MKINITTSISELLGAREISQRSYNALLAAGINTASDIMVFLSSNRTLLSINNLGRKSEAEILKLIKTLKTERLQNSIPDSSERIQVIFDNLFNNVSVRARNFKTQYIPSYHVMVDLFNSDREKYKELCPGRNMAKTLDEIYKVNQEFRAVLENISNIDYFDYSPDEIPEYPYLSAEQVSFVKRYTETYGYRPLFFLFLHYCRKSKEKADVILGLRHGIIDGISHSVEDIAKQYSLSTERIKQLLNGVIPAKANVLESNEELTSYMPLFSLSMVSEQTHGVRELINKECSDCVTDAFWGIFQLLSGHTEVVIKNIPRIFIASNITNVLKLKPIVNSVRDVLYGDFSSDTAITIDSLLPNVNKSVFPSVVQIIIYIIRDLWGFEVRDDGVVLVPQNKIDVESEIIAILEMYQKPLGIDFIFQEFKNKYPDHKYASANNIRPYLLSSNMVKPIGKSSTYALSTWEHVYFGNIRDFLEEILSESEEPMHIDEIMKRVELNISYTNRGSVESTMQSGDKFVCFEGNLYGLSNKNYGSTYKENARVDFEARLEQFKTFVEQYHRFPFSNGGDEECALRRWYHRAIDNNSGSTEQINELRNLVQLYKDKGFPLTQREYNFREKCKSFKQCVNQCHILPDSKSDKDLSKWFEDAKRDYLGFEDQRYYYFEALILYVKSLGFEV